MINDITILGNVGRDAESKVTQAQKEVISFSMAHSRGKDKEGKPKSFWMNVTVFEGNSRWWVDQARGLKKGDKVLVKGAVELKDYIGRDGAPKQSMEIIAHAILPLPKGNSASPDQILSNVQLPKKAEPATNFFGDPMPDEIPF